MSGVGRTTVSMIPVSLLIRRGQEKLPVDCGIEATSYYHPNAYNYIAKSIDSN
jgi:hypothetical protein